MPKKIQFEKKGNAYVYEAPLILYERSSMSYVRVPKEIAQKHKGQRFRVRLEPIPQNDM